MALMRELRRGCGFALDVALGTIENEYILEADGWRD